MKRKSRFTLLALAFLLLISTALAGPPSRGNGLPGPLPVTGSVDEDPLHGVASSAEVQLPGETADYRVTLGVLEYIPRPDVYICFCGEYHLVGEEGFKSYYLLSDTINLWQFIGKKILVAGMEYTDICDGTLALPCDYLIVDKVISRSPEGTLESDWGILKMIYR